MRPDFKTALIFWAAFVTFIYLLGSLAFATPAL